MLSFSCAVMDELKKKESGILYYLQCAGVYPERLFEDDTSQRQRRCHADSLIPLVSSLNLFESLQRKSSVSLRTKCHRDTHLGCPSTRTRYAKRVGPTYGVSRRACSPKSISHNPFPQGSLWITGKSGYYSYPHSKTKALDGTDSRISSHGGLDGCRNLHECWNSRLSWTAWYLDRRETEKEAQTLVQNTERN